MKNKGGNHKHMKKDSGFRNRKTNVQNIPVPSDYGDESVYIGLVTGIRGGYNFTIRALNNDSISSIETIGWLRASKARGPRVVVGTVVLYALRDYESREVDKMKGDIEYVYVPEEVDILKQLELIPHNYENAMDQNGNIGNITDAGFDFTHGDIKEEEFDQI